jgi:pSer/pThr/pTyr-binding forkhead associated (FHA) protein
MPRLDFYADHQLFVKVRLEDTDVVLGRCDDCTVQLPHDKVSRYHAVINRDDQGYWIRDSSLHGTRVNDKLLDEPRMLQAGDRIGIERYTIIYRSEETPDSNGNADTSEFDG